MKEKSVTKGILATVVVWLTAGWSVPLVNEYRAYSPEMLLIVRGLAVMVSILLVRIIHRNAWFSDWKAVASGIVFGIASVAFFRAVSVWGANPTITVLTLTPIVNFVFAVVREKKFPWSAAISLAIIVAGVFLALQPWKNDIHPQGLVWAILAAITSGLGFECWGTTKATKPAKFWWYSVFTIVMSAIMLKIEGGKFILVPENSDWKTSLYVFSIIGSFGGIAYFWAATVSLENLPTTHASVLLQGETPAVIIGSAILIGTVLSRIQWVGIGLTLVGICYLVVVTERLKKHGE